MAETFSVEKLKEMKKGIEAFNHQLYWECHEELEVVWLEDRSEVRNVYWAVIQVAAALVHYQNNNIVGARGMMNKAREKFTKCEPFENELMNSELSWHNFKKLALGLRLDFEMHELTPLFHFRFKDYTC